MVVVIVAIVVIVLIVISFGSSSSSSAQVLPFPAAQAQTGASTISPPRRKRRTYDNASLAFTFGLGISEHMSGLRVCQRIREAKCHSAT